MTLLTALFVLTASQPAPAGCPDGCSRHGVCFHGLCICESSYYSSDCSLRSCPRGCCDNGVCMSDGVCECRDGFVALQPDAPAAENDCCGRSCASDCGAAAGRGHCDLHSGTCACSHGWRGDACELIVCPSDCSHHGRCSNDTGLCECYPGWEGSACADRSCEGGCGGRGLCVHGACQCVPPFTGRACERRRCPQGCSGHGRCMQLAGAATACACLPGWAGPACADKMCPAMCSSHGACLENATCACDAGWSGEACDTPTCAGTVLASQLSLAEEQTLLPPSLVA